MKTPLVSVIIPVYDHARYLAPAIESVLAQTYEPLDTIVVDDGSTDASADVARSYFPTVRYSLQPHFGAGAARNRGVELAEGVFFAFLDADDLWSEHKLSRQMAAFNADPELDMVFGFVSQFLSPDLGARGAATLRCPTEPVQGIVAGTMLIKRESFFRVGLFEANYHLGEFVDWYAKAMEIGLKSLVAPEVVLKRRIHSSNQGIRERSSQTDYVKILKACLDRRRRAQSFGVE
ncbi:MAG: glycosyltransferase family 2 protein [Chloroflexi bacterium]|nr:glycosyltransferase family 2 protein [Chloroflexota bacterium]